MPALKWPRNKEKIKYIFGPTYKSQVLVKCFDLVSSCPGFFFVDCPCQFLMFRPRNFADQPRKQLPEALTHHLDENCRPTPMVIHQTPPFRHCGLSYSDLCLGGLLWRLARIRVFFRHLRCCAITISILAPY